MRQQIWVAALVAALWLAAGCRRDEKIKLEATEETPKALASSVHAADPDASVQLIKGFHGIEHNSWRWTLGRFAITLKAPAGAADRGGTLTVKFSIPAAVLQKSKTLTMSASVQGTPVGKQTYKSAGEYTFTADIPPNLLKGEATTFEFSLDPFLPAGTLDARELGVVFVSAALESK